MSLTTIRQLSPVNARTFDLEAPFAERRYEYLIARRDQANDRIRTGSLALNGSSLVAMLALLSGEGKAAAWIGLTSHNTALTAAFFVVGAALSGSSIVAAGAQFATEAGDAFGRMLKTRSAAAAHEAYDTQSGRTGVTEALAGLHASPLVDFQYSPASIFLQSCGASAWIAGMCVPLASAFGLAERAGTVWKAVVPIITILSGLPAAMQA